MNNWGESGEERAKAYLEAKGFRWLVSNFSTRWGEIDLIMEDEATLVFIEVKFRRNREYGEPEESITPNKMRHMERVAMMYVHQTRSHERFMRFDVVVIGPSGLKHYENAFLASGGYY